MIADKYKLQIDLEGFYVVSIIMLPFKEAYYCFKQQQNLNLASELNWKLLKVQTTKNNMK